MVLPKIIRLNCYGIHICTLHRYISHFITHQFGFRSKAADLWPRTCELMTKDSRVYGNTRYSGHIHGHVICMSCGGTRRYAISGKYRFLIWPCHSHGEYVEITIVAIDFPVKWEIKCVRLKSTLHTFFFVQHSFPFFFFHIFFSSSIYITFKFIWCKIYYTI